MRTIQYEQLPMLDEKIVLKHDVYIWDFTDKGLILNIKLLCSNVSGFFAENCYFDMMLDIEVHDEKTAFCKIIDVDSNRKFKNVNEAIHFAVAVFGVPKRKENYLASKERLKREKTLKQYKSMRLYRNWIRRYLTGKADLITDETLKQMLVAKKEGL